MREQYLGDSNSLSRVDLENNGGNPDTEVEFENPEWASLNRDELYQLTLYKWQYSLEALGFDSIEVSELMFIKWLVASRRLDP